MKLTPREPAPNEHRSCPSHCCPIHGCKYGHDDCPVATGKVPPQYPNNNGCEYCEFDATHAAPSGWQPIETAPRETELLVGRWVNSEWRICQSGFYSDGGNDREGEPAYWYWHCGWDNGGVTDSEGPTHWMPLPAPPSEKGE